MSKRSIIQHSRVSLVGLLTVALLAVGLVQAPPAQAVGTAFLTGNLDFENGRVEILDAATGAFVNSATGQSGGEWAIYIQPGSYKLRFSAWTDTYHGIVPKVPEYWNDAATLESAEVVTVASGESRGGLDASLADEVPSLSGQLLAPGADWDSPNRTRELVVYNPDGTTVAPTQTRLEADGSYRLWGVPAGTYFISARFYDPGVLSLARTFVGDVPTLADSTPVTVISGTTATIPPITLPVAASLAGNYTVADGGTLTSSFNPRLELLLWSDATQTYEPYVAEMNFGAGAWSAIDLWPGKYLLHFYDDGPAWVAPNWWPNQRLLGDAETLTLTPGQNRTGVNAAFEIYTFYRERTAGADRFATNVAMSKELFPPTDEDGPIAYNIPVLYIANGLNYPDALGAGPAAAHLGGELLLVTPDVIPDVIRAEIIRLNPQRIVVVGGPPSVSPAVYTQLAGLVPHITRKSGADRYATARELVRDAFGCDSGACVDTVFVATGANYPDALAAGPVAGKLDVPVLLVYGAAGGLDAPTLALLDELGVSSAQILGSPNAVSSGIEADLEAALAGPVGRFAGDNRFQTAVLLNEAYFDSTSIAFLASGLGFADALSGGPLVTAYEAPLYLSTQTCIPNDVIGSMVNKNVDLIVLFGGTPALTQSVFDLQMCS